MIVNEPGNCEERIGSVSKRARLRLCLAGVLILALGLRLWGIGFGLPQRYHIDEPPYVLAALRLAAGDLYITYPYNSPNLFQFMLTGLYGLWYIVGWIAGAFRSPADFAALYQRDPSGFYLLARGLVAVLSTGTVALLYLLGRSLSGKLVGLLAAGFLALAFGHAREAHYAVTDTLVTGLVVASLLGTVLYARSSRQRYLVLAGMAGGAAVGLKYLPALVLLPSLLALFQHRGSRSAKGTIRKWGQGMLILGCSSVAGFFFAFPAPLFSLDLFWVQWHQVWTQASGPLGGIQVDPAPFPLYYLETFVWGQGLAMTISAALGLVLVLRKRQPTGYVHIVLFAVGYFASISMVQTAFARYALPLVPLFVLLAAEAVVAVIWLVQQRASTRFAGVVGVLLCLIVGLVPAANLIRYDVLLTRTDTRTLARDWIEAHVPPGTRIAVQWYGPALSRADDPEPGSQHTYDVVIMDPFDVRPKAYDLDTYRTAGVTCLVVNSWNKGFQHQDPSQTQSRQRFYAQLDSGARLVARFCPTLTGEQVPFVFEQIYGPYTSLWQIVRPGPEIEIYALSTQAGGLESRPYVFCRRAK